MIKTPRSSSRTTRVRLIASSATVAALALGGLGLSTSASAHVSAHDPATSKAATAAAHGDERPRWKKSSRTFERTSKHKKRNHPGTPVPKPTTPKPAPAPTTPAPAPAPSTPAPGGSSGYRVPAGTALKPSGKLTVSQNGAVISGLDVNGCITVRAANVTIKNTRVRGTCDLIVNNAGDNLVLDHVEIDGKGTASTLGIGWNDFTARNVYIHGVGDGIRANGDVVVERSYITDLASGGGSHNDGIQVTEGKNIRLSNNVIENRHTQTAAIMIGADQGSIANLVIENNVLAGGGFSLYGGARPPAGNTISGIVIRNNQFSKKYFSRGGAYGPMTATDDSRISVSGNVWQGTSTPAK